MKLYILITILVCLCNVTLPFSCIPQAKKLNHHALFSVSSSGESVDLDAIKTRILGELREVTECATIATKPLWYSESSVTPEEIVKLCDDLDDIVINDTLLSSSQLQLRRRALEFQRYELLCKLMRKDYQAYVATASFLSPSRIPRKQLPNLQDIPLDLSFMSPQYVESGLVPDCSLESVPYDESILDQVLLQIFRSLVTKNTGGLTSNKSGIDGLLEQGRTFMLQPNQTDDAQHRMVRDTLRGLMTPVLPPFYRVFMSGIVPSIFGTEWDGKQLGPWFYAPFLTSFVTPTFFGFLVGPSYPNRRKDGQLGGLVVEKCKFLQESGCKGLCLHQCKLPAQQFFKEELGLPLTVSPNFVTQECQWSFGEEPLPPSEDPSFPKGCLVGCESRKALVGRMVDLCN
jgi:Beta-carotene isomerase D27-like, C-terminal